jgi:tetratricopeptide (TPR) repeat protein
MERASLEASPVISVPHGGIWRVPGARNTFFTGRERVLAEIRHRFVRHGDQPKAQVIVAFGGVGKTQVAAEYAWRHRVDYSIVWWIPAEDATTLALSYAELAKRIGLALPPNADLDTTLHILRRALEQLPHFLLIFDNAPSAEAVRDYLPLARVGHTLITSRDTEWGDIAQVYPLHVMEREESVAFLAHRVGWGGKEKVVAQVAQTLGDLPLAMEQAAAHIVESRIDFATYLYRFESHWAELLEQGTGLATPGAEYPDSLAMSLELTFRQLEENQSAALSLLNLFAFFSSESIPPWLLDTALAIADAAPLNLVAVITDFSYRNDAMAVLRRYSLIEGEDDNLHVHRLVSALARRRLAVVDRAELANFCLRLVTTAFDFDSQDPHTWPLCALVLPHALEVANHAEALGIEAESAAKVMNVAGRFLMRQNRLIEARQALVQALNLARKVHGPLHTRLAGMSNDLGRVLQKLGDPIAAREYFEKSLRIDENIYGQNESHAASVVNNYAITLHADGDLSAAREYFERALKACETEEGAAHWRVATVRNNLACVLRDSGDASGAKAQFELALESGLQAGGEMHPLIAQLTFNLGNLLRNAGDRQSARTFLEQALQIDRHNHGPTHPNVARDLAELAALCRMSGDDATAHSFEEEARSVLAASRSQG